MHEAHYESGVYSSDQLGLEIGWVAEKSAFAACMPAWNERKDVCVIFSGEDYIDSAEIDNLRAKGHQCEHNSATYLPHLYEEYGMEFLARLDGCFSGVLMDFRESKAILFNDRYGLGRVYYHESKDEIYFASEAKAFLRYLPCKCSLSEAGFAEFIACGSPLEDRTLYSGVSLLPPASAWTYRRHAQVEKRQYFDFSSWEEQEPLSIPEYYTRLSDTFTKVLPRYFRGVAPIGLSLTGGLDSRMVIAGRSLGSNDLPCFTFGGMYRECADVRIARYIAGKCGQSHTVATLGPTFLDKFAEYASRSVYYTDGAMDVTGGAEIYLNRRFREIASVRMTGNYGSEILRGNRVFKVGAFDRSVFDASIVPTANTVAASLAENPGTRRISFIVRKQLPWHHFARFAVEQSQMTVRSPFLNNELVSLAYQAPPGLETNQRIAHRHIADLSPMLSQIPTDRNVNGSRSFATGRVVKFRQEFLPRMEYMFDYGMPQWLSKLNHYLLPPNIEQLFLGRQKFAHFRVWYRDELSSYVREMLLDKRTLHRPYLNARRVQEVVENHTAGLGNYTLEIHKLLTCELIQREIIEQN